MSFAITPIIISSIFPIKTVSPPQGIRRINENRGSVADYRSCIQGGYDVISEEALPSLASSTQVFANAPAGTALIRFTLRSQGVTMRLDGNAATALGNGVDLATGSYEWEFSQEQAKKVRMIQAGATTTGWIQYLKVAGR